MKMTATKKGTRVSYKTVLVHVDEGAAVARRVALAAAIAGADAGHLVGVALTGVSRFLYQNPAGADPDPNLALHLSFLHQQAGRALAGFEAQAEALGVDSFEARVADDEAGGGISLLARYADLVVIGQIDPEQPSKSVMADFPAYVVIHCGKPVLIVPHAEAGWRAAPPRRILIGWDGGKQAGRAVSAALPLLRRAEAIHIAVFDAAADAAAPDAQQGAELARYLARHGIAPSVQWREAAPPRPGALGTALLARARALDCDLLVIGAYGHSRFRESILGGVSRTVLREMTLPVLMAH
jgi:nucleotide-binding universal stress UspA family protein